MVYWLCWEESAIPSIYYFWFNTICHCISIVQNMIVDATLMDDIELSHDNLDAVLGEPKTELIGCWTYYLSSNKTMLSLFIQSSADIAHNKNVDSPVKMLSSHRYFQSCHHPIQCKILFKYCKVHQVLGSCIKLLSEAAERVQSMLRELCVGIKICTTFLIDLQLGAFLEDGEWIRRLAILICCVQ